MNNLTKDIISYSDGTGRPVEVFVDVESDTVWLTLNQLSFFLTEINL